MHIETKDLVTVRLYKKHLLVRLRYESLYWPVFRFHFSRINFFHSQTKALLNNTKSITLVNKE